MKKKVKKESDKATLAGVKKEMAKPRMAKSARKEEVNQAAARIVRGKRREKQAVVASASSSAARVVVCALFRR